MLLYARIYNIQKHLTFIDIVAVFVASRLSREMGWSLKRRLSPTQSHTELLMCFLQPWLFFFN